jgi:hypothetical protein
VTLAIAGNTGSQRTATVTIAGQIFTASQDAAAPSCSYSISPTTQSMPAQGGSVSVRVTTASGCAWTATSGASWITISGNGTGQGNGTVNIAVSANAGNARNGNVTIAGQTLAITEAAACHFSIAPTSQTVSSAAGTRTVTVTAQSGCSWTAESNDPDWLSISSGKTGTGNGTVTYAVMANTKKKARTGHLTIAGQTFEVSQSGSD